LGRGGFFKADDSRKHSNRSAKNQLWDICHDFLLREWVNMTMLCYQQQDDFLLSTTLRRLDYRKIPSRFLQPQRRTDRRPVNNRRISGGASGADRRSPAKLLTKDERGGSPATSES
jgi:hypothetical protein